MFRVTSPITLMYACPLHAVYRLALVTIRFFPFFSPTVSYALAVAAPSILLCAEPLTTSWTMTRLPDVGYRALTPRASNRCWRRSASWALSAATFRDFLTAFLRENGASGSCSVSDNLGVSGKRWGLTCQDQCPGPSLQQLP